MVATCPACGAASRDQEFCDRCNAELVPAAVSLAPAVCPLETGELQLTSGQRAALARPEAAVLVAEGERAWRLHWIPAEQWPAWRPRVEQRQGWSLSCLPPCRIISDPAGAWVVAEVGGPRPEPWAEDVFRDIFPRLRLLEDILEEFRAALETLHAAGLVWLNFHPGALEEVEGQLRFTNLDLEVFPGGQGPEELAADPAFAAPEAWRFEAADIGPRTDVFHLALYAYYWLAGYLPQGFLGEGLDAFDFCLPPLRILAPTLPPGIAPVLERGLARVPAERYASVRELCGAFQEALGRAERRWRTAAPVRWDIGLCTRIGPVKEALGGTNQDAVLVRRFSDPERALVMVADGISTCDVGSGDIASRMACEIIEKTVGADCREGDFGPRVTAACREGSQELLAWALRKGARYQLLAGQALMGTTVLAGWLEGNALTLANLGDSRAYLVNDAGIEQLTVDGDLGCALLAAGSAPEELVQLGEMAHALRDCMGGCYCTPRGELAIDEDHCRPALGRWPLLPGEIVILCTDGLVEEEVFLDPSELRELVGRHSGWSAADLAEKLVEAAEACQRLPTETEPEGSGDNITCAVIKIS